MTPAQTNTVAQLKADGFEVTQTLREIIRMAKGADIRIVKQDGMVIRGHHHSLPPKARRKGERA